MDRSVPTPPPSAGTPDPPTPPTAPADLLQRELARRFHALGDLAPVGIFQADPAGDWIYANPRLGEILDAAPASLLRRDWAALLHPDDRPAVLEAWSAAVASGREFHARFRLVTRNGALRWIDAAARPLRDGDGRVETFLGALTDISPLRDAESRLRDTLAANQSIAARETLLLRELNHRVRNNLAGLLGLISIYERAGKSGPEIAAALRGKVRAISDVHDLISNATGGPVPIAELIARITAPFRQQVAASGPEVPLPPAYAAPLAMTLQELLTNAAKHGALSSSEGRVVIGWSCDPASATLTITWTESGGPNVREPQRRGAGLDLIDGLIRGELRGQCLYDFAPEGFACILRIPLSTHLCPPPHANTQPQAR